MSDKFIANKIINKDRKTHKLLIPNVSTKTQQSTDQTDSLDLESTRLEIYTDKQNQLSRDLNNEDTIFSKKYLTLFTSKYPSKKSIESVEPLDTPLVSTLKSGNSSNSFRKSHYLDKISQNRQRIPLTSLNGNKGHTSVTPSKRYISPSVSPTSSNISNQHETDSSLIAIPTINEPTPKKSMRKVAFVLSPDNAAVSEDSLTEMPRLSVGKNDSKHAWSKLEEKNDSVANEESIPSYKATEREFSSGLAGSSCHDGNREMEHTLVNDSGECLVPTYNDAEVMTDVLMKNLPDYSPTSPMIESSNIELPALVVKKKKRKRAHASESKIHESMMTPPREETHEEMVERFKGLNEMFCDRGIMGRIVIPELGPPGCRRSTRVRVVGLDRWNGEQIVYKNRGNGMEIVGIRRSFHPISFPKDRPSPKKRPNIVCIPQFTPDLAEERNEVCVRFKGSILSKFDGYEIYSHFGEEFNSMGHLKILPYSFKPWNTLEGLSLSLFENTYSVYIQLNDQQPCLLKKWDTIEIPEGNSYSITNMGGRTVRLTYIIVPSTDMEGPVTSF